MVLQKSRWSGSEWVVYQGAYTQPAEDEFVLGVTMPTKANSGVPSGTTLSTYDPSGTLRSLVVSTPGTTFTNVDFGNVKVAVRAANVSFIRCRWTITDSVNSAAIIYTVDAAVANCLISQCDLVNLDQKANINANQGHDMTVYRCKVQGTTDGIDPSGGGNVKIRGNYISDLCWLAADTNGVVHGSDVQSHSDCIQIMYAGVEIIGNFLGAYPSLVVGTGTPGSGTDTGNTSGWYTQAQANARRAQLLGSSWTNASRSYDGVSHENGGVITPLMCNVATGSTALNLVVEDNWFGGGVVGVNGLATNLTSPMGVFNRNRFFADFKTQSGGRPVGIFMRTASLTATIPSSGADRNVWMDNDSTVARVNNG
ncbi:MAG: hypothetical protein WBP12_02755 [Candidatus Saccharimonas sp.]